MSEADQPDNDGPDIPDKGWTNPFCEGTPLHDLYGQIIRQSRDLVVLVDDFHARRGTGKTVASMQLANGMDQTEEGLIKEKVSMEPEEIRDAYANQPKRSGLVLDEGEVGASNRQAMSKVNQALREIMSMGRVEEKYVVVNSPAIEFIDKDIQKLADVWISMVRKGEGIVHFFERQPYAGKLLTPKKQLIEFEDIATDHRLRNVYNYLTRQKRKKIRGDDGGGFIPEDEHQEKLERAVADAKKEKRDELIKAFYEHPETEASQRIIGEAAGDLTQQAIGSIIQRSSKD